MVAYTDYAEMGRGTAPAVGTPVTSANLVTYSRLPSGYGISYGVSGSPTAVFGTSGIDISGPASTIARIDVTDVASAVQAARFYFKPTGGNPTTAANYLLAFRGNGNFSVYLYQNTAGTLEVRDANNAIISAFSIPAMSSSHLYQVDCVVLRGTSTSNGRIILRIVNLDSQSWASGGTFYYDTGQTVNTGVSDLDTVRLGKQVTTSVQPVNNYTYFAWGSLDSLPTQAIASTNETLGRQYFLPPAYGFFLWDGTKEIPLDVDEGNSTATPIPLHLDFKVASSVYELYSFVVSTAPSGFNNDAFGEGGFGF